MIRIYLVDGSHIDTMSYELPQATDLHFAGRPLPGVVDQADNRQLDLDAADIAALGDVPA